MLFTRSFAGIQIKSSVAAYAWILIGMSCLAATAQAKSSEPSKANAPVTAAMDADSTAMRQDNTQALLPSRLGPLEKVFWSEHGFMRRAFDYPLTVDGREKELATRRTMLNIHQFGGYVTFASMVTTATLGQLYINGNHGLGDIKSAAAWTTVALYFGTAAMSLFTPPPLVRRDGWSTLSTHKLLANIHFSGMILVPILGTFVEDSHTIQTIHQIGGYVTTATFGAAMLVMTF